MAPTSAISFLAGAPAGLDTGAIEEQWHALRPPYDVGARALPAPLWARRGFSHTGAEAWSALRAQVRLASECRALCIYIHIPFCIHKCAFCDCYSFQVRRNLAGVGDAYVALLEQEMRQWSALGTLARRPVSTVHLGGGTPTALRLDHFERLIAICRGQFGTGEGTEWALESTTSELTETTADRLLALGFTRLHIGVQSLEEGVRTAAGRREPADVVLRRIRRAVASGWIVSVDLIVGLPGQTLRGSLDDIDRLSHAGVDGFSLYQLQLSPRNRLFAERHGLAARDQRADYFLFQAAAQWLGLLGYRKTLFNHLARDRDTNLYFTFPERDEDCLALGAIADGVFGDYHYRHPEYKAYCRSLGPDSPGLEGGLRRTARESALHRLETALLSGTIHPEQMAAVLGRDSWQPLLARWQQSALVSADDSSGALRLTGNGSWFAGAMMRDLSAAAGSA